MSADSYVIGAAALPEVRVQAAAEAPPGELLRPDAGGQVARVDEARVATMRAATRKWA